MKYTKEQTEELRDAYLENPSKNTIEHYATLWNKSPKSIISKLSRMDLYHAKKRVSKITGGDPQTKHSIVKDIEKIMGTQLDGLDKAPKIILLKVRDYVTNRPKGGND